LTKWFVQTAFSSILPLDTRENNKTRSKIFASIFRKTDGELIHPTSLGLQILYIALRVTGSEMVKF